MNMGYSLLYEIPFNQTPHIFPSHWIHCVQADGIMPLCLCQSVQKFDAVSAIEGIVPQIMVAVDQPDRLICIQYRPLCLIDAVAPGVTFRRGTQIIQPYFHSKAIPHRKDVE